MGGTSGKGGRMTRLKFDRVEFIRNWFVFLICIDIQTCCYRYDVDKEIGIHFLWWHIRFYLFKKGRKNDGI